MPVYRATVTKFHAATGEYWTNVYWISGADIDAAHQDASNLINLEKALLYSSILITSVRTDDAVEGTDAYRTYTVNTPGSRTPSSDMLPLWVTARVDFTVAGGGRPSRKYIRGCLEEADMTMTAIGSGTTGLLNTYAAGVAALAGAVDVDGAEILNGVVMPVPQMRQLRRGSKKRSSHNQL